MDNTTSPNTANTSGLGFRLELRTDVWVVQYDSGGCHPANADEIKLWHALEATEAELTRRDEVIERAIKEADELLATDSVNHEEDNYDAGQVHAAADIKAILAAAPVSLEAVKAETADRRPHSRACGFRKHEHGTDCNPNCQTCHGRSEANRG